MNATDDMLKVLDDIIQITTKRYRREKLEGYEYPDHFEWPDPDGFYASHGDGQVDSPVDSQRVRVQDRTPTPIHKPKTRR